MDQLNFKLFLTFCVLRREGDPQLETPYNLLQLLAFHSEVPLSFLSNHMKLRYAKVSWNSRNVTWKEIKLVLHLI